VYIKTLLRAICYLHFTLCCFLRWPGYPNENAAHVALKTVREWLEEFGDEVSLQFF